MAPTLENNIKEVLDEYLQKDDIENLPEELSEVFEKHAKKALDKAKKAKNKQTVEKSSPASEPEQKKKPRTKAKKQATPDSETEKSDGDEPEPVYIKKVTGNILFRAEHADSITVESDDHKKAFGEKSKKLAEMWREADKEHWEKLAEEANQAALEAAGPNAAFFPKGWKKSKKAGAKKTKDPSKKRARTSYILYCLDKRPELVEDNPDADFREIGKLLGEAWREETDEVKAKYAELSQAEKDVLEAEQNAQLAI